MNSTASPGRRRRTIERRKTHSVRVTLPEDLYERLQDLCARYDVAKGTLARAAIKAGLKSVTEQLRRAHALDNGSERGAAEHTEGQRNEQDHEQRTSGAAEAAPMTTFVGKLGRRIYPTGTTIFSKRGTGFVVVEMLSSVPGQSATARLTAEPPCPAGCATALRHLNEQRWVCPTCQHTFGREALSAYMGFLVDAGKYQDVPKSS